MNVRPQCSKVEDGRRCPDSAGYVIVSRLPGGALVQIPGGFCRRHAKCAAGQQRLKLGTERQSIHI
jgi:hypothetical protein